MAHAFKISNFGIKLIKAYEGFKPVETTLATGQRIIGYGHKYHETDEPVITSAQAETILLTDLQAYENMINENVFAPLVQSQFDALVSLSFNIGPKAFLSSTVLHRLNNGQVLAAASGFDEWSKSNIDGKTYVVDALVRRRTAEKALFLRTDEGLVSAPRHELPPQRDTSAGVFENEIYVQPAAQPHVDQPSADQSHVELPHVELQAVSNQDNDALPVNEVPVMQVENVTQNISHERPEPSNAQESVTLKNASHEQQGSKQKLSPIALAAEEVSERLDRLIADNPNAVHATTGEQDSPILGEDVKVESIDDLPKSEKTIAEVIADIKAANEGTREDYKRPANQNAAHSRSPDRFIQKPEKQSISMKQPRGFGIYWLVLCLGTLLCASGAAKLFLTPKVELTQMGAFMIPVATVIGVMLMIGSLYYLYKNLSKRQ